MKGLNEEEWPVIKWLRQDVMKKVVQVKRTHTYTHTHTLQQQYVTSYNTTHKHAHKHTNTQCLGHVLTSLNERFNEDHNFFLSVSNTSTIIYIHSSELLKFLNHIAS